jgi:asparagine synthase (glutamine-hydrolysing)
MYEFRGLRAADGDVLHGMLDLIHHRGPDDGGAFVDGPIALGSRRLSIIDIAGGHQPMSNEDGSVVVVQNGEIYNYRELRADLVKRGHTVTTSSDTESIVHLYEDHAEGFVEELRGMFGIAIWDARRRRLVLARDRLGVKPLYYTVAGGRLVFGSEIKAILRHPDVDARPSDASLAAMLALKYVPAPATMFQDIYALPPGHRLICDEAGPRIERYWDVSFENTLQVTEAEAAEQLEALLVDAVRSHLVSDVPFGAFLSGGLDSSTVVALMSQILDTPVQTFAVGFSGAGESVSELPYARLVAERWGAEHHEVMISANDFMDRIEDVVWHLDQPIADEASLPNHMVSDLAAQHVKMVLSGEGGDELFAGYARYSFERLSPIFGATPRALRSLAVAGFDRLPGLRRPKIALRALCEPDEARRMANWFPLFNEERLHALLRDRRESPAAAVFAEQLARAGHTDQVSRMLYVDTKLWLPDDLLARGDKTSMAVSLEARVPLLDHPLVEFAASLPTSLKLRGRDRKYLLRKVAAKWLPEEILTRKKQGFPTPISEWFRGESRAFLRSHLSPETVARRGIFDPAYVAGLLDEHERRTADHGTLLYGLLNVELWYRAFVDSPGRVRSAVVSPA